MICNIKLMFLPVCLCSAAADAFSHRPSALWRSSAAPESVPISPAGSCCRQALETGFTQVPDAPGMSLEGMSLERTFLPPSSCHAVCQTP